MVRRRDLFALSAAGLLVPRRLLGASSASQHKFLFVYCYGGWDTSMVFTPMIGNPNADLERDASLGSANGIPFIDSPQRPNVRTFFEDYGDRTCLINGIEVRSVTHERCQRILLTGSSESGKDDWPAIMAGNGEDGLLLPHLVVSGPSFSTAYSSRVVRVGDNGQLNLLLDGTALQQSTTRVVAPSAAADAAADTFLKARLAKFSAGASAGSAAKFGGLYQGAIANIETLKSLAGTLDLDPDTGGCSRDIASDAASAFDCFELGISRCAITRHDGWCAVGWDTHVGNDSFQSLHYDELFGFLNTLLADLDTRTSATGAPLRDEVTVVVLSEMGRHPQLNLGGGKDHWTFTSCMLIGAGIRGGQVIGALDTNALGRAVDLGTGALADAGESLLPGHLGATLLQLADVDPAEFVTQGAAITAALEG